MDRKTKAIIYMILSSLSFSVMSLVVKMSSLSTGLMQQVFFRNLLGLIISYFIIKKEKLPLFERAGYITRNGGKVSLTDSGMLVSNAIITELIL